MPRTVESRVSVDSLVAAREFVRQGFVAVSLNWEPLLWNNEEGNSVGEIKWPECKPETKRVTSELRAMAAYRELPPPSATLLRFVSVVGDVLSEQTRLRPPRDILRAACAEARKSYRESQLMKV
jgi:hypothetical protein